MTQVLLTGPAGTLGSVLVPRLVASGHRVRVLTHRHAGNYASGIEVARGDVCLSSDVAQAASGVGVIIHAATSPFRKVRTTELEGIQAAVEAAEETGAHLIYPSIVGVDTLSGTYYRAKWAAERIVQEAGCPWTIQRATQLHPTLNRTIGRMFPVTAHLSFQPLDSGELADCLVGHVDSGPAGRAEDLGGPGILTLRQLVATRRTITGKRTLLVRTPALGPLRDLDAGHHLCPDHARGHRTWKEWLSSQCGAGSSDR